MQIIEKNGFSIHTLSKEEFNSEKNFFIEQLNTISISLKIQPFSEEYLLNFFDSHSINSFVYIKSENKIVGFIYSTPHRDYDTYDEFETNDLTHWGVNYIQVHKDFNNKGFGSLLVLACCEDVKQKGASKIDFMPNKQSISIFHHAITGNNIGTISLNKSLDWNYLLAGRVLTISFSEQFLKSNKSILFCPYTYLKHEHKKLDRPFRDYWDYYFNDPAFLEELLYQDENEDDFVN